MDSAINNQIFPGAQVFIAKNGQIVFNGGFGFHDYEKGSSQVSKNSIYDIASITKVLSITPIIMKLISRKKISLDQPVYYFLPDFRGKQKDKVTIRHLMTHSSGITSYHRFFLEKKYLDRDARGHIYVRDSLLNMPSISKEEIRGLMKTFVLYARLPRSYWKDIKIAESENKKGIEKYNELMALFRKEYAHIPLAAN